MKPPSLRYDFKSKDWGWPCLVGHLTITGLRILTNSIISYNLYFIIFFNSRWWFTFRDSQCSQWGCAPRVEVTSLLTFFAPTGSHIVQEDADMWADGWPFRPFPRAHIYSGNRNSPQGRGWRKTRSSLLPGTQFLLETGCDEEAESSAVATL